ncbi:MAG TPA: DedA family protein [Kribbellaceae bacterium]|nr:DedA family protein [Kribbellaceae bacterium]
MDFLGWLSPEHIFAGGGAWALWISAGVIFAECGLLVGFFLPGDTLLFSIGMFAASGAVRHPVWLVCLLMGAAAVLGNIVGYGIGHRLGDAFLRGEGRRQLVDKRHIERTEAFFAKYGAPAIVLARFVGVVRTLITVVAGAARMDRTKYITYSTIGAVVWAGGLTLLGFFLGRVPFVQRNVQPHLDLFVLIAVGATLLSVGGHLLLDRWKARKREPGKQLVDADELVDADARP